MSGRRSQWLGWSALAVLAGLGALWLARLDYREKISTDILDLIPEEASAPELSLVRQLAGQAEARTMLIALTRADGTAAPVSAARQVAGTLRQSPVFAQALALADTALRDAWGQALFSQRLPLLFPFWLREREAAAPRESTSAELAAAAVASLGAFLATPEGLAFQELLPADPLLLLPGALERLPAGWDLLPTLTADAPAALVWAQLAVAPFSEEGQEPAFAAIEQAVAAARAQHPDLTVAYSGVNRFAAASQARIRRDITWLNTVSVLAVLAIAAAFIRQVWRGLHLVPVVLFSMLGAWVGVTLAFHEVHILVFAVGSLLTGVAIDYGFYLYMQPPAYPGEPYGSKVARLAKPLLASCLTTVVGFALLLWSDLALIRQLGVFVGTGLLCALGAALVYFATVKHPFLATRTWREGLGLSPRARRWVGRAVVGAWLVALPGLARLTWKDDIRDLEVAAPELKEEDARLRAWFGERPDRTVYLTYGASLAEARVSLEAFAAWLRQEGGDAATWVNLGAVVPTPADVERATRFVRASPEFAPELRAALQAEGYELEAFERFFADYAQYAREAGNREYADLVRDWLHRLAGPAGLLAQAGQPSSWFVTLARGAPTTAPPANTHTVSANQLQSLNRVFAQYRQSALRLSLIGLAAVGAGVFLTYGWRDGVRIFALPAGACLGLFGLFGWWGHPLNLFHLLGAFLGVCLTHNYSIFTATSAYRREPPPVSVRMSALTTATSFGVLALSGIPVVRALGSTVAVMVLMTLLAIECEHFGGLRRKP